MYPNNTEYWQVLLVLDGHASHRPLDVVTYAREHDVALLCLPPHTTHRLQPLDRTFFLWRRTITPHATGGWRPMQGSASPSSKWQVGLASVCVCVCVCVWVWSRVGLWACMRACERAGGRASEWVNHSVSQSVNQWVSEYVFMPDMCMRVRMGVRVCNMWDARLFCVYSRRLIASSTLQQSVHESCHSGEWR